MGFLTLGYGKLMAGKRVRDLQNRMMTVQSQMRRAARDVANMEKYINSQQRQMTNSMRMYSTMMTSNMQGSISARLSAEQRSIFNEYGIKDMYSKPEQGKEEAFANAMSAYQTKASIMNNEFSSTQQMMQSNMATEQSQIENNIEMMKEMQLEPLKDIEEELQLEKDSLETQMQLAEADYNSCKESEKASAKNMIPQYTGQG